MTDILPSGSGAQIQAIALRRRTVERRREALENLRRLAVQLEAASTLDHQADRSNPTLAAVLRERAEERRRIAAVVRAHLDGEVGSTDLSRVLQDGSPGGRARHPSPTRSQGAGRPQARSAGSSAAVTFSGWSLRNRYQ